MFDSNVIDKLISIEKKILNSFKLLLIYKNINPTKYEKELLFLKNVLFKKEDLLISKLPTDEDNIELVLDIVFENKGNFFDDDEESFYVLERFRGILKGLLAQYYENDEYYDEEYEFIDSPKNEYIISNNLDMMFIQKTNDCINDENENLLNNIMFLSLYRSFDISRWVISNNFDFSNLYYYSDEKIADQMNLDKQDYYDLLNDVIYNNLESLMSDIDDFLSKDEESPVLKQLFLKFKFLLNNISNDGLILFKKLFDNSVRTMGNYDMVIYMNDLVDNEFKSRNIVIPEKNKTRNKLSEEIIDNLISLIKLEGKIYSMILSIDFDSNDKNTISQLSSLLDKERILVNSINVDNRNSSVIKSVIEEDLSLFLNFDEADLNYISKRLFNIINYYYCSNISPSQSFESYDNINKCHVINSLKKYLSFYNGSDAYSLNLKRILFVNDFLTFDFVCTGNLFMLEHISDDIVCDMLGMDYIEYEFDQNEQLYDRANDIMNYMFEDIDDEESSFLLCEMDDICEKLPNDYIEKFDLYNLPSDFDDDDDVFGKMVADIVRNKKTLKSIMKKR